MSVNNNSGSSSQPATAVPCEAGCGFFGNPLTQNMCSRCYKDFCGSSQPSSGKGAPMDVDIKSVTTPTTTTVVSAAAAAAAATPAPLIPSSSASPATLDSAEDGKPDAPSPAKAANRCTKCAKKLGLAGALKCRCGHTFCSAHLYSGAHDCTFDYKAQAAQQLTKANPVVMADKLNKI